MSKCEICGGHKVHREEVEEVFYVNGRYALVEHIPATVVCLQCGERPSMQKRRKASGDSCMAKASPSVLRCWTCLLFDRGRACR